MPALKLFGRKWLAASDDLVLPCIVETIWRVFFLIFFAVALCRYWTFFGTDVVIDNETYERVLANFSHNHTTVICHEHDALFIKIYLIGVVAIVALNLPLLMLMIYNSSRGSIVDTDARKFINPLLYLKIFLILPETAANVMGTLWVFCSFIQCTNPNDSFANSSIEVGVIFYWVVLSLIILSFILAYDPLGAKKFQNIRDGNGNFDSNEIHNIIHRKVTKLWLRRFKLAFCCVSNNEFGDEAFTQSAELFSHIFRGTDLVPSDLLAGSILLRVRQKKEQRELQRIQMLNDNSPRFSSDLHRIFNTQCPQWMTLRNAQHFLRFAVSSYGWPMIIAIAPCRGCFGMMRKVTCCACFRKKRVPVVEDNCCQCHSAGMKFASRVHNDDVIFASFKNQVFEVPFCILADHSTKSVVLTIRGSWSLSDIFTDLSAAPKPFYATGMPEDTVAHHGMAICCEKIIARLMEDNLLERALAQYPEYDFVITGHSLGAGLAVLIGAKLRSIYPHLKVYGFATPSGLLSREAAKYTEQFVFTLTVGDDFVTRMSLEGVECLKTGILETLQSCKLPKYRVILNGFTYAVLGIPTKDLEKTWYDINEIAQLSNHSSTLLNRQVVATISHHAFGGHPTINAERRQLFNAGRILHIVRKKKTELEKGAKFSPYEMRWASPEDFTELKVMPRMMLDHFPHNILRVLTSILNDRNSDSILSVDKI